MPIRFSAKGKRITRSRITELMRLAVTRPKTISLASDLADYKTLPIEAVGELASDLAARERSGRIAMQYGTTEGLQELREAIWKRFLALDSLQESKVTFGPECVVVTTGSQQMLYLLTELLVDPGDVVVVANPTNYVFLEILEAMDAKVAGVRMDEKGMIPEDLEAALETIDGLDLGERLKIVYIDSYFQNPTGITCSLSRKRELFAMLRDRDALIVEGGTCRELRYEGVDLPSVKSLDDQNKRVAYLGTYSKSFAPGLKIGYGILPRELAEKVVLLKGRHDFGSGNFVQHLLAGAHRLGIIDGRLAKLKMAYKKKRDIMEDALNRYMGELARWRVPRGGLFFFLELVGDIDTGPESALFKVASEEEGVLYVPGAYCQAAPTKGVCSTLRLSFASVPDDRIIPAVERLAEAVRRVGE